MHYTIRSAAGVSTFLATAGDGPTVYSAQILTTDPDIGISVKRDGIKVFVDTVPVSQGEQWTFVADHQEKIRTAVTPLLDGFASATILGRWIVYKGRGFIEPYAVELIDASGKAKVRSYDLRIFQHDENLMTGCETSFTDEGGEQIMSVLMSMTEDKLKFDETAHLGSSGWPIGLFWFSDDGEACFAYNAIGQRAFLETRYARIAEEVASVRAKSVENGANFACKVSGSNGLLVTS
ncbi:hypothetical protein IB276_05890 [Ensifer sp. ENS04]|uniref:hypothetical protein n=1 Tax=Ensifer sp. ENS04 TaxID=2769281 RepID=UPI00177CF9A8|nr:hypothetical protein [Ensifer sp. ENS04]MBD9538971.1 hypothetical protein [Ensifer sp. ENS04]